MIISGVAIVFDLDGVLADSTYAVNASWEAWAKRHDIDRELAIANGHGRPSIDAIRLTAPHLDADRAFAEMEALEESFLDSVVPIEGAREFVERVNALEIPWAVATSGTRRIALPRLQRTGIPQPRVMITADAISQGKPHPEPYECAARALDVHAWECVVFEDAPSGILSARRAGAAVIAIAGARLSRADACVADFLDVDVHRTDETRFEIIVNVSYRQCPCCESHTLRGAETACPLCKWAPGAGYDLAEAQRNAEAYGVMYRPTDARFASSRHPILGPKGEHAIDRVALRERAYFEFRAFAKQHQGRARLTPRLSNLLKCIKRSDALYTK